MAIKTPEGSKRADALTWNPYSLFIVGLDKRPDGKVDGPEHPRWDARVNLPVDPDLVDSIARHGRNLQTVTIVEVDGVAEVEDGRQRVRAARVAFDRLIAAGVEDRTIIVETTKPLRGYSIEDQILVGHELNGLRQDDDMMTKCEKVAHAIHFADPSGIEQSKAKLAKANRMHPSQIDQALTVVERACPAVKDALRAGRINLALARDLAAKPYSEQPAALDSVVSATPEGKTATRKQAEREATGKVEPSKRTLARLMRSLAELDDTGEVVGYVSPHGETPAEIKLWWAFVAGAEWAMNAGELPDDDRLGVEGLREIAKVANRLLRRANTSNRDGE